jgi:hypothetical protein
MGQTQGEAVILPWIRSTRRTLRSSGQLGNSILAMFPTAVMVDRRANSKPRRWLLPGRCLSVLPSIASSRSILKQEKRNGSLTRRSTSISATPRDWSIVAWHSGLMLQPPRGSPAGNVSLSQRSTRDCLPWMPRPAVPVPTLVLLVSSISRKASQISNGRASMRRLRRRPSSTIWLSSAPRLPITIGSIVPMASFVLSTQKAGHCDGAGTPWKQTLPLPAQVTSGRPFQ